MGVGVLVETDVVEGRERGEYLVARQECLWA